MKIITKKGIEEFCKQYKAKLAKGNVLAPYLAFYIPSMEFLNKLIWKCRDKKLDYYIQDHIITLKQDALQKIISAEYFEEKRIWAGKDQYFLCEKMEHQHLSNTIGYLEILLTLGKINKKGSEDYMEKLQTSIVPELEERFNGEILPYKPHYAFEEDLYKEYQKAKAKG